MTQSVSAPPGGIFISYRRIDTEWAAHSLHDFLSKSFKGVPIFMDIRAIEPGDDFYEAIESAVEQCNVMLALIGKDWLTVAYPEGGRRLDNPLDFVRIEIETALSRGIRLIPVMVSGARHLRQEDLPREIMKLARKQALPLATDRFRGDMQAVVDGVSKALERASTLPPPPSLEELKTEARAASAVIPGPAPSSVLEDGALRTLAKVGLNPSALTQASFERTNEGAYVEAEQLARIALHRLEAEGKAESEAASMTRIRLASVIMLQGRVAEAVALIETVLASLDGTAENASNLRFLARYELADGYNLQGRSADAEAAWRALLPDLERVKGASHPAMLATRFSIARAQLDQGRAAEAEAAWRALLPDYERVQGASHPHTFTIRSSIARAQLSQGRAAEAEAAWRALLPDMERVKGASHPDTLITRALLVAARARLGDFVGAREAAGGLPEDLAVVYGQESPDIGRVLLSLGELAAAEGDRDAAARRFDAAEALWRGKLVHEAFQFRELAKARARWLPAPAEPGA